MCANCDTKPYSSIRKNCSKTRWRVVDASTLPNTKKVRGSRRGRPRNTRRKAKVASEITKENVVARKRRRITITTTTTITTMITAMITITKTTATLPPPPTMAACTTMTMTMTITITVHAVAESKKVMKIKTERKTNMEK